jgi:uncharacterized protein (DUF58 family)
MRPTGRGYAVIAVAIGAVVLAAVSGPRALNAVAAPLFAAVGFGAVQLRWLADPVVELEPIDPGFPNSTRQFRVGIDGSGVVRVTHAWPEGLDGEGVQTVTGLPVELETAVTLRDRGRYQVRAPTIHRRDALGLVHEVVDPDETTTLVVYPEVYGGTVGGVFARVLGPTGVSDRGEFAGLREYTPGDPLRDIHWKSSAKRDDFLVTEFEPSERVASVLIAASAAPGAADRMAAATATLALAALESGLAVGVRVPGRRIGPGAGRAHRTRILEALAGASHGDVDGDGADVHVEATPGLTRVRVGETTHPFDDLLVDRDGRDGVPA